MMIRTAIHASQFCIMMIFAPTFVTIFFTNVGMQIFLMVVTMGALMPVLDFHELIVELTIGTHMVTPMSAGDYM